MRRNHDLTKPWKIPMPATLAGRIEMATADPVTKKPRYGVRTKLIVSLLEWWAAREAGQVEPSIPTLEQLRQM